MVFSWSSMDQKGGQHKYPLTVEARKWLLESIRYFRELGFFTQYRDVSDEELVDDIESFYNLVRGLEFDPTDELADLELLQFDSASVWYEHASEQAGVDAEPIEIDAEWERLISGKVFRVWWEDLEADVCAGNEVYVETLQQWSRISRGAFLPQDIEETWEGEEGPIWLAFTMDGTPHRIQPEYLDDFIDLDILNDINRLISGTGYRFEVYNEFDQTAFVVVLTAEEKEKLERERGWRFVRWEE